MEESESMPKPMYSSNGEGMGQLFQRFGVAFINQIFVNAIIIVIAVLGTFIASLTVYTYSAIAVILLLITSIAVLPKYFDVPPAKVQVPRRLYAAPLFSVALGFVMIRFSPEAEFSRSNALFGISAVAFGLSLAYTNMLLALWRDRYATISPSRG
jgi:hypothetical protein